MTDFKQDKNTIQNPAKQTGSLIRETKGRELDRKPQNDEKLKNRPLKNRQQISRTEAKTPSDSRSQKTQKQLDGVLVINKPAGMTSFDVIAKLRRKTGQKKFGHTGTLDPMASGVLVVLAGKALKILQFIEETDKTYQAGLRLGKSYSTDDIYGEVTGEKEVSRDFDFEEVLSTFKGNLHQKVPSTSAKKVNGKKLLEYQRQGLEVPEVYSDVTVYSIHPIEPPKNQDESGQNLNQKEMAKDIQEKMADDDLFFEVECSSGTYIRSICRDFGTKTGNLAAMSCLVRTKANGFTIDQASSLEEEPVLYPIQSLLNLPAIAYQPASDIKNGKRVHLGKYLTVCFDDAEPEGKQPDQDQPDQEQVSQNQPGENRFPKRVLIVENGEPIAVYDWDHGDVYRSARGLF